MANDDRQTIPRRLLVPVVATLVLITLVTCFICWQATLGEFHHFEQVTKGEPYLPAFCEGYQRVEFLNLVIPLAVLAWAGRLLHKENCPLTQLVWFTCGTILTVFLWATASFLAVYLLHLKFYRFM